MTDTVDQKLLKQTKFPAEFNQKVDMQKVNIEVMKKCVLTASELDGGLADGIAQHRWIAGKISEILGGEDDVVIELCFNLLEGSRYVGLPFLSSMCPARLTRCCAAQHQGASDTAYRVSGQRHGLFLQRPVDVVFECTVESARRAEGAFGSQEARADSREGEDPMSDTCPESLLITCTD